MKNPTPSPLSTEPDARHDGPSAGTHLSDEYVIPGNGIYPEGIAECPMVPPSTKVSTS